MKSASPLFILFRDDDFFSLLLVFGLLSVSFFFPLSLSRSLFQFATIIPYLNL